jgi:hypothetical protein
VNTQPGRLHSTQVFDGEWMVERRSTARRGIAALIAGMTGIALLAMSPARGAVAGPEVAAGPTLQAFELEASGSCYSQQAGTEIPVTVRTSGTAPTRVPVQSGFTVTVNSATVRVGTDLPAEPVTLRYDVANAITTTGATTDYRFSDPATQTLNIGAGVYGPLTIGGRTQLVVSVGGPASTPETVFCLLSSATPVTVALDLPADGGLQWFRFSGYCRGGRADLGGGVAPTRVAPGVRPHLVADLAGGPARMSDRTTLVLGISGSSAADTYEVGLPSSGRSELDLPAAGAGGSYTVLPREINGVIVQTGPDGAPRTTRFSCPIPASEGGTPLVIAVGEPGTTTSTSTTSTTTTRPPATPTCDWARVLPPWLWRLLVQLFRLDCPSGPLVR